MTRTDAREWMMKVYYQMDVLNDFDPADETHFIPEGKMADQEEYCRGMYRAFLDHGREIDKMINDASSRWKTARMAKTDVAILRIALAEMLYRSDVPTAVSINEAVELAKKYGTEDAPKFINGILGTVARGQDPEAFEK